MVKKLISAKVWCRRMTEHWEWIMERELNFYLHFAEYKDGLQERLFENEMDIEVPVTRFDAEAGCIYRHCLGTEDMAIKRILVRDALHHLLEKAEKRMTHLAQLFSLLDARNKVVLRCCYLDTNKTDVERMRQLGLKNKEQLQQEKEQALKALYSHFVSERQERLLQERKQRAALLVQIS